MYNKLGAVLIGLSFFFGACSNSTDSEAIRYTFQEYQKAIQEGNGLVAANLLDSKTLEWYDKLVDMANGSNKAELQKSNFFSKVTVLAIRQEFDKKGIEQMDAKSAFAFAVEKNLYGNIKDYTIANIKTDGERAVARMEQDGELSETYFKFIRENGKWYINFASMINLLNDDNTGRLVQNIPGENKNALKVVSEISSRPIKSYIWTPAKNWR